MNSSLSSISHRVWTDKAAHEQPAYADTHIKGDRYDWAAGRKVNPIDEEVEVKAGGGCLGMC